MSLTLCYMIRYETLTIRFESVFITWALLINHLHAALRLE
jgi:hypothetical protein